MHNPAMVYIRVPQKFPWQFQVLSPKMFLYDQNILHDKNHII